MDSLLVNTIVQFTQSTVALLFAAILSVSGIATDTHFDDGTMVVMHTQPWGVSFGGLAFANAYNEKHEVGHVKQQEILGWLYLPVVAIPSLLDATINRANHNDQWYEQWADELGGD